MYTPKNEHNQKSRSQNENMEFLKTEYSKSSPPASPRPGSNSLLPKVTPCPNSGLFGFPPKSEWLQVSSTKLRGRWVNVRITHGGATFPKEGGQVGAHFSASTLEALPSNRTLPVIEWNKSLNYNILFLIILWIHSSRASLLGSFMFIFISKTHSYKKILFLAVVKSPS